MSNEDYRKDLQIWVKEDFEKNKNHTDEEKEEMEVDPKYDLETKSAECAPECDPNMLLDVPVPPGHVPVPLGVPHPKAKPILLRFATKADEKLPGAEKGSKYYQKHGNPNYGDSLRSRQKPLRMRMYADDEELKAKRSRSREDFSKKKLSVHSRLGSKYTRDDLCRLGTYRDYDRDRSYYEAPKCSEISRPKDITDLRSKLKKLRSDDSRRVNVAEYDERGYNVKEKKNSYFKRKHRSPLCEDDDDDDDEDEDDF